MSKGTKKRKGQYTMISTDTWWESIFSGPLAYGINQEKIRLLEDEQFLYFKHEHVDEKNKEDISNH